MSDFKPTDPDFERKVSDSFSRQGLLRTLGARLAAVRPGYCEILVDFDERLTQQHGFFHAGVSGAIADTAMGYAGFTLMPPDSTVLSVEYKINLVAPADGERLVTRARVVRSGRTLKVCTAEVVAIKGGQETLCAVAQSTMMCLMGKPDTRG